MAGVKSVDELLVHELADLYDAEQQLVKALPKVAKAAHDAGLKQALEQHLEATRGHVTRLEAAFGHLNEPAKGEHCDGMAGLIKEANKALEEEMPAKIRDMAILAGGARIEHYEISGYTSALTLAMARNQPEVAELLRATLEEEQEAAELMENSLETSSKAGSR